mmetsp:Transcript_57026/g.138920  ORF Transcript_57026/g.138920 Transcript_57026/m.138920 type:complete len:100 (-) Transcript_57026:402-701(-)
MPQLAGGFSEAKDATPEIQKIADLGSVKSQLLRQMNLEEFQLYNVLAYKQQVVAGMVYDMKIQISSSSCLHVKVFQPLPHEQQQPSVMNCEEKSLEDPL